MDKITTDWLENEMGFYRKPSLIQDSWAYVLYNGEFGKAELTLAECNDKGLGEFYVFIHEFEVPQKKPGDLVSLGRNLVEKQDLIDLLTILKKIRS